jgi:ATP-dependent helicase HrpA
MDTPWPWLIQFPRYLTAIRQRLQRLASGGLKTETSLLQEFVPWHRRYEERLKQHQSQHRSDPMLEHYRWMLEEYRVSLFAQKLGTAIAVSTKKLEEQWQRVT